MAYRVFTDPAGTDWQVWDVRPVASGDTIQLRNELADGWLAFSSSLGRRRLVPIPDGWETWEDDALCIACTKAVEQPPKRRLVE